VNALAGALEAAERYAETGRTKAALKRARQSVKSVRHGISSGDKARFAEWVALWLSEVASENAVAGVGSEVVRLTSLGLIGPEVQASSCKLMRCVFGNPFRSVPFNPAWLTHAAAPLAQTISDDRAIERMPELADALEAAGYANTDILDHRRGSGPHVPGYWVVNLILGKE
jgi:hypothetical protein